MKGYVMTKKSGFLVTLILLIAGAIYLGVAPVASSESADAEEKVCTAAEKAACSAAEKAECDREKKSECTAEEKAACKEKAVNGNGNGNGDEKGGCPANKGTRSCSRT